MLLLLYNHHLLILLSGIFIFFQFKKYITSNIHNLSLNINLYLNITYTDFFLRYINYEHFPTSSPHLSFLVAVIKLTQQVT